MIKKHFRLKTFFSILLICTSVNAKEPVFNFEEVKNNLWQNYIKDAASLETLKAEYDSRALKYKDKTMRFSLQKIGEAPKEGHALYIALHGGGSAPSSVNDSQWEAMKNYYRGSVKEGIYVAPRGISNNWNLHFESESYPLYDKLIESAILFDHVDPNRVYFLGFSAGGDGVYQVVTRMPARFAAANMSAGHSNGLTFDNLYNTPFLMQVGEYDSAYDRNHLTASNYIALNELALKYGGGFKHNAFIHYSGSHNSWRDNDSSRRAQLCMINPVAWLKEGNRETEYLNSNAIDWISDYTRNPHPEKIVWDLNIGADSRDYQTGATLQNSGFYHQTSLAKPNTLFYWLDVSVADSYPTNGKLVVEISKATNTIHVIEAKDIDKFRILLNPNMLDLSSPIILKIGDEELNPIKLQEDVSIMQRTMLERSDIHEIYDAEMTIIFDRKKKVWQIN